MEITITGSRRVIRADQYDDVWQSIAEINQEFTSENTSINDKNIPALYSKIWSILEPGTINVDYGGGRFDNVAEYLEQLDIISLVIDPFNRSSSHNQAVLEILREAGGADTATCANVLNVIKEKQNRIDVLKNIKRCVKPGGTIYFWIYEGGSTRDTLNKDGSVKKQGKRLPEGETSKGYQLRWLTEDYLEEIRSVFPDAKQKSRTSKMIIATNSGSVSASHKIPDGLITL